mgnify:CR=1 FL=1
MRCDRRDKLREKETDGKRRHPERNESALYKRGSVRCVAREIVRSLSVTGMTRGHDDGGIIMTKSLALDATTRSSNNAEHRALVVLCTF